MAPKPAATEASILSQCHSLRALASLLTQAIPSTTSSSSSPPSPSSTDTDNDTDPLAALAAAPTVYKAQATRLGLLLVNEPLTLSALQPVLDDLTARVLPAVFGAGAQVCGRRRDAFGRAYGARVAAGLRDVLGSAGEVADAVERVVAGPRRAAAAAAASKDEVLVSVGKVYSACDELVAAAEKGVVPVVFGRAKGVVGLVEDAMEELREWGDDVDEDAEEDDEEGSGDEDGESEDERRRTLEELTDALNMGSSARLPRYRKDIILLLEESLWRVDLVKKLFLAMSKRRVRKFPFRSPPFETAKDESVAIEKMKLLDATLELMELVQSDIDELAGAFYELDAGKIQESLDTLISNAKTTAKMLHHTWDGDKDDFTAWITSWQGLMEKGPPQKTSSG